MGWQWHQLNHMQAICTSLQKITTPAPHHSDFMDQMPFLTPSQQCQSYEGTFQLLLISENTTVRKLQFLCIFVQAWSIVFHSWLSFVLLISACLMWMVPKKRQLCLRCSPIVVFYAICLLTLQYVYGFNLNDDELPTTAHDYNLSEIGLVKYRYPVGPLAAQVCLFVPRRRSDIVTDFSVAAF